MGQVFGFLNINKPLGLTSHDVVAQIRRGLGIKKVGHAGTLDPMATGVLIICLGMATRLSDYAMHAAKRYRARIHLGVTTDTYDTEGQITEQRDSSHITQQDVENALNAFVGNIQQVPPMYSAIKQGGRKLYELARAGKTVERELRGVTISALELVDWQPPQFTLDVSCGAGTYIRSLAFDVGEALGVGAHLAGLVRTQSGTFTLDSAISLDTLLSHTDWQSYLLPPDKALQDYPALTLNADDLDHVQHGRAVQSIVPLTESSLARAYDTAGRLVALLQAEDRLWRPHKVFLSAE